MREQILHILKYFALFSHPLTVDELYQFLPFKCQRFEFEQELAQMIEIGEIKKHGQYFQRKNDPNFRNIRIQKEERAIAIINKSHVYAGIIARFPFVQSIAISGSVSKLSAGKDADLDFFIVTTKDRLWICRTLLHLFKKLTFISGHEKFFCMNYFVDDAHLELPFQNFYTALELRTLIPIFGLRQHKKLQSANIWTDGQLPNHGGEPLHKVSEVNPFKPFKPLIELVLNLLFPGFINRWLMLLTDWKWRRKFASLNLSDEEYDQALMTRPYLSKNHPHNFQKRVQEAMESEDGMEKNVYA